MLFRSFGQKLGRNGEILSNFWPNARVPYVLDQNLRQNDAAYFQQAIDQYHSLTCIRFQKRTSSDQDYIHVQMNFSPLAISCGSAYICRIGSNQSVTITNFCSRLYVFVHELGHALCLRHEFLRVDRDEFLHYRNCSGKPSGTTNSVTTKGHIFDYSSQMMYGCGPCVGLPAMDGVSRCSSTKGLTPIDADKINTYYNCQGSALVIYLY